MAKPTQEFGYINFGKDGSIRKVVKRLPDNGPGQELEVAQVFAQHLDQGATVASLPQDEPGDCLLTLGSQEVLLQLTEVSPREFMTEISEHEFVHRKPDGNPVAAIGPRRYAVVDQAELDNIFIKKIAVKKAKAYQKPRDRPFWLVIWTTEVLVNGIWIEGGRVRKSPALIAAQAYCASEGIGPFDEVWFQQALVRPHRVWPM
jgi:hypothetical protein